MASDVKIRLTPKQMLERLGLTELELARRSGLGIDSVRRAVRGNLGAIKYDTAYRIAEVFNLGIEEVAWPMGLTNVGRPPLTGGIYVPAAQPREDNCPGCGLILPVSGECSMCAA